MPKKTPPKPKDINKFQTEMGTPKVTSHSKTALIKTYNRTKGTFEKKVQEGMKAYNRSERMPNKSSPNNPYNNAGPKVRASSRGPTDYLKPKVKYSRDELKISNAGKAAVRATKRAVMTQENLSYTMRQSDNAREGMFRKNAQAKATNQYKRLVKETPGQYNVRSSKSSKALRNTPDYVVDRANKMIENYGRSYSNPPKTTGSQLIKVATSKPYKKLYSAAKSGVGDYAKYNAVTSKMGGKSPSMQLPKMDARSAAGAMAGAGLAQKLTMRTVLTNPVVDAALVAGTIGYGIGTTINKYTKLSSKIAEKLSPKYDPGTYKINKDSGQVYKTKKKK